MVSDGQGSTAGARGPAHVYGGPYGYSAYGMGLEGEQGSGVAALRRLRRAVLGKWWLIALGVALGLSAAWFILSRATPLYRAESLVEMSVRRPRIASQRGSISEDTDYPSSATEDIFNTRIQKFRGARMRELVTAHLQAATNTPALSGAQIAEILGGVKFAMLRRSYLVSITCVCTDPALASLGANAFAEGVVLLSREENRIASDNAVAWLEQQVLQQQKALATISDSITAFRETKHIDASLNEKAVLQASLASIGAQLTGLESARVLEEKLLDAVRKVALNPQGWGQLPDTTPRRDEIVLGVSRWLQAIEERNALLARYTPEHPEAVAREKLVKALAEQVAGAIARARSTAEANVRLLTQQTEGLRQRMEAESRKMAELEGSIIRIQAELAALDQEMNVAGISYRSLLTRIEEARLAADENTATAKTVEPAVPPRAPFTPRRGPTLMIGLLLGLVGGLALALAIEILEDRFIGTDDLERALGLRVLGLVPRLHGKTRSEIGTVANTDCFGHGAEAYAGLRAGIVVSAPDRHSHCLLVTSAGPREGKTITASNLAIAFARAGVKTLLVDFDMRRPKVGSVFGLSDKAPCLLDVLGSGKTEAFPSLPVATDCQNLAVVWNHASREYSAADVMGRQIIRDFVSWARAAYDVVILDSPPFGVVSDALVLAGVADGVLFVSRPGVSRRRSLRGAIEEFAEANAPLLGIVVNAVKFGRISFLGNYDYRYGRGYRTYSYPTRDEKKQAKGEPQ